MKVMNKRSKSLGIGVAGALGITIGALVNVQSANAAEVSKASLDTYVKTQLDNYAGLKNNATEIKSALAADDFAKALGTAPFQFTNVDKKFGTYLTAPTESQLVSIITAMNKLSSSNTPAGKTLYAKWTSTGLSTKTATNASGDDIVKAVQFINDNLPKDAPKITVDGGKILTTFDKNTVVDINGTVIGLVTDSSGGNIVEITLNTINGVNSKTVITDFANAKSLADVVKVASRVDATKVTTLNNDFKKALTTYTDSAISAYSQLGIYDTSKGTAAKDIDDLMNQLGVAIYDEKANQLSLNSVFTTALNTYISGIYKIINGSIFVGKEPTLSEVAVVPQFAGMIETAEYSAGVPVNTGGIDNNTDSNTSNNIDGNTPGKVGEDTDKDTDSTTENKPAVIVHTDWVDEDDKPLVARQEGIRDKKDIPDYEFVKTTTDKDGNTIHHYKKVDDPVVTVHTDWVDEDGKSLIVRQDGTKEKKDIPDYEYVKTAIDNDGNTIHYYKKVDDSVPKPVETVHTDWVDEDGKSLIVRQDGTKEKKDITDYEYVKTTTDKDGNTIHHYKKVAKITTDWVDEKGNKLTTQEDGTQPVKKIEDYEYVETKTDQAGNTIHHYKKVAKITTDWVDEKGNKLTTQEDGSKPVKIIDSYTFVNTTTDEAGNVVHHYKKNGLPDTNISAPTPQTVTATATPAKSLPTTGSTLPTTGDVQQDSTVFAGLAAMALTSLGFIAKTFKKKEEEV